MINLGTSPRTQESIGIRKETKPTHLFLKEKEKKMLNGESKGVTKRKSIPQDSNNV